MSIEVISCYPCVLPPIGLSNRFILANRCVKRNNGTEKGRRDGYRKSVAIPRSLSTDRKTEVCYVFLQIPIYIPQYINCCNPNASATTVSSDGVASRDGMVFNLRSSSLFRSSSSGRLSRSSRRISSNIEMS